ncbi:hypothetical protein KDL44_09995 [bacterium]|nr:hypothetical protein [bacterium]
MWDNWLFSHPELAHITLDVGRGLGETRSRHHVTKLVELLMPWDEKQVLYCLDQLAAGDSRSAAAIAARASAGGSLQGDTHLLAGAFALAMARPQEAVNALEQLGRENTDCGEAIRRMYPGLRILLRITPTVLIPVYPNDYGAGLMLAVARWACGESGAALEDVRDLISRHGMRDELRLLGGYLLVQRGELDRAIKALQGAHPEEEDAVALDQALILAYALSRREQYREAARALTRSVRSIRSANQHLQARCKLLLAELYDRCEMPFEALAISSEVPAEVLPPAVARSQQQREERWLTEALHMGGAELERMARANPYMMYVPDAAEFSDARRVSKLDIHRDPVAALKPREMSWLRRKADEHRISEYRSAVARGENVPAPHGENLTTEGRQFRQRVRQAEQWWPGRSQALSAALTGRDGLQAAGAVGHALFDFCSQHEGSLKLLEGEQRARFVAGFGGMVLAAAIIMIVLRLAVYGGQ